MSGQIVLLLSHSKHLKKHFLAFLVNSNPRVLNSHFDVLPPKLPSSDFYSPSNRKFEGIGDNVHEALQETAPVIVYYYLHLSI